MIARAASDEEKSSAASNLGHVVFEATEHNQVAVEVDTPSHCVHHGLWLFVDLLRQKRTEIACT